MNVVKRSEYCNGVSVSKKVPKIPMLADIPQGTVFRGSIGVCANIPQVWVKLDHGKVACVGEPKGGWLVGFTYDDGLNAGVRDYEVLNATLVIEGE